MFRNRPDIKPGYLGAARAVRSAQCTQVGLVLDVDDWEYPLWVLLPEVRMSGGRMEHVGVTNVSGRLASKRPDFHPCAVIATNGEVRNQLNVNGQDFETAWSAGRVKVFTAAERQ